MKNQLINKNVDMSILNRANWSRERIGNVEKFTCTTGIETSEVVYFSSYSKIASHKCFVNIRLKTSFDCRLSARVETLGSQRNIQANTETALSEVISVAPYSGTAGIGIQISTRVFEVGDTIEIYRDDFITTDLTQLDQDLANTANLTPKMVLKAYPDILSWDYDTGTMVDAEDFEYSSSGINQWDEEWEVGRISAGSGQNADTGYDIRSKNYIKVLNNTSYTFKNTTTGNIFFYDINKNYLGNTGSLVSGSPTFTTPANCGYIRFCTYAGTITTYNNDIQICLHYTDTEVENTYHPYVAPSTKEIKYYGGKGRSAGSVRDEVDYVGKKKIKRVGTYTFTGNETWSVSSSGYAYISNILTDNGVGGYDNKRISFALPESVTRIGIDPAHLNFIIVLIDASVITTSAQLNAIFSAGKIFYYELATPVEEDITDPTELNNALPCNDYGIESKSDGVIAGMKVKYQLNPLRTIFNNKEDVTGLKTLVGNNATIKSTLNTLGFYEVQDLSDGLTDVAGLTVIKKYCDKIGSKISFVIVAKNETGNEIPTSTPLFRLSNSIIPSQTLYFNGNIGANSAIFGVYPADNYIRNLQAINNNSVINIVITFVL